MKVVVRELLEGAKEAQGLVVIIDVFRATSTITSLLANGAEKVIAVEHVSHAFQLKKEHPEYLIFGERKGLKVPGFDYGNVPKKITTLNLKGKTAVITTSAGTRGLVNSTKADEVLAGCFLNADAVLNYIRKKKPKVVTFVAMGIAGKEFALEDRLYAGYMKARLEGKNPDFNDVKEKAKHAKWGRILRMLGLHGERDFCLLLNNYSVVGKAKRMADGSATITRVK